MDNEIVIQLAKFNDKTTTNNSNWTNNTSESITINNGDQILVSKAFIDTRDLTSANIIIEKDLELELEYHFYWINDSNPGTNSGGFGSSNGVKEAWIVPLDPRDINDPSGDIKFLASNGFEILNNNKSYTPPNYSVQITSQNTKNIEFNTKTCLPGGWSETATQVEPTSNQNVVFADGRPYLMCYSDNSLYTQTWNYTLKAGSYSPDSLASLLTLNMATVKKDTEESMADNKANDWFNSGQPFVCNTTSYPPIWSMSNIDYRDPDGDGPFSSVINCNPFIQIDKSRGSVLNNDWYIGSTGSVGYLGQPGNYNDAYPNLTDTFPIEKPGLPANKSLCFKNFISDSPTPNPSINLPSITNPTITANNMIPGLYYKIISVEDTDWIKSGDTNPVPAISDEFLCVFTGTVPESQISVSQMKNGGTYKIVSLGNNWNGLYDTNWLAISNTLTNPTIGEVFICQNNIALQIATTEAEIDTTNTFTFTSCIGYDLSTIGGPTLPTYTIINKNIYDNSKQNDWITITSVSPNFIGRVDNGIDYTQFMGALQTTIPNINTQYISTIDMTTYNPVALNGLTDLNNVNYKMNINVTTNGKIRWDKLGAINSNPILNVNNVDVVVGSYIVTSPGISYGLGDSLFDTDWSFITGGVSTSPNIEDTIDITALNSPTTAYTNATIHNTSEFANTDFVDNWVIITDMGTSTSVQWIEYGDLNAKVGSIFLIINNTSGVLNTLNAKFQILKNTLLQEGMKIEVTLADKINWALYTNDPTTPITTGEIITITDLPLGKDTIIGSGAGYTPMTDTFTVLPSGTVKSINFTVPFQFIVSKIPSVPFTDTTWVASLYPVDTGETKLNYTLPIQPFKSTGVLSSNVINKIFSANVLPTAIVEQNVSQGTCIEIFSPDTPNFYIYPLTLQNKCNSVSYLPGQRAGGNPVISQFFGGPQFTFGFPLVGSTEIELAFNDSTNRFQWNYTHSPIQQGSAPGTTPVTTTGITTYSEVVGMINSFVPNTNVLNEPTNPPYNSSTCKLTSQSGILFRKMEPAHFWQDILGFSKDLIVTDEELGLTNDGSLKPITPSNKDRFTLQRFNDITTTALLTSAMNFTTLDNFPNAQESYVPGLRANTNGFNNVVGPVQLAYNPITDVWAGDENLYDFYKQFGTKYKILQLPNNGSLPTTSSLNSIYYQSLDETKYINSISPPLLVEDKYGHYLVSINGYGNDKNGLINEKQKILSKAIISNYYVNENSFVSLTFPDSQVYTHVGEPIQLNNFEIGILDPDTMKPIEGLGENSCVYIQINKQYSKEDLNQINP